MRTLLSLWTWLDVALVSFLGFWVLLALAIVTWPFDRNRRIAGRWFRLMGVAAVHMTPMWRFRVHGELPAQPPTKTVVVSNHCSHSDVFLIGNLPWEMKWLGKASLFRIPFIGWGMWLVGDIAVVRGAGGSVRAALIRAADYLDAGMPVMIFPEGTRSLTGEMRSFKDGAFRLAIDTQADILPIAIAGTQRALGKHNWRFGFSRAFVTVGETIETTGMTFDDIETLKQRARSAIETMRQEILPLSSDGAIRD